MRACISSIYSDEASVVAKARKAPEMLGRNLVDEVSCGDAYKWSGVKDDQKTFDPMLGFAPASALQPGEERFQFRADEGDHAAIFRRESARTPDASPRARGRAA